MILSLRRHVLDSHGEVRHLQVLVIDESILALDKDVEEADVQDDPQANDQVHNAHHNGQVLTSDSATPRQIDLLFFTLDGDDEVWVIFDGALGLQRVGVKLVRDGGYDGEGAVGLPQALIVELGLDLRAQVAIILNLHVGDDFVLHAAI